MSKRIKNGFSLIEILFATAVSGILLLGTLSSIKISYDFISRSRQYSNLYGIESEVRNVVNNESSCMANLNTTRLQTLNLDTTNLASYTININSIVDLAGRVVIERSTYGGLEVTDLKVTDLKTIEIGKTYLGNISIYAKLGNFNKVSRIPIFFSTSGTVPNLTLARCGSNFSSQLALISEQVCVAMSGTFDSLTQKCTVVPNTTCTTPGHVVRGISAAGTLDCVAPPAGGTVTGCSVGSVVTSNDGTSVICGPGPDPGPEPPHCAGKSTSCYVPCPGFPGGVTFSARCDSNGNPFSRVAISGTILGGHNDSGWVSGFTATASGRCYGKGNIGMTLYWTSPSAIFGSTVAWGSCNASF